MNKISISLILTGALLSAESFAAEVSITMDDFNVQEATFLSAKERNVKILDVLKQNKIQAALFVACKFVQDQAGKELLVQWDQQHHIIGNHTFNHIYFGAKVSVEAYQEEILKCEESIKNFSNFNKLLRFPYLGEGDTSEKRDLLRSWLSQAGYKNGYVTIDASDW